MSSPTVILGAGIIGLSTAYYLSQHQEDPTTIHLVEPSPELFSSASGYAGGFLARDWFGPSLAALGALSFDEHRRLAEQHGGREKWGYAPATCVSYVAASATTSHVRGDDWLRDGTSRAEAAPPVVLDSLSGKTPAWLRRVEGDIVELISDEGTTAQVDPLLLCRFLLGECVKRGVRLHHPAKPVAVVRSDDGKGELAGVRIADTNTESSAAETELLPCSRLIITAGSWTGQVFQTLFPASELQLPIKSLAGHSLVVKSPRWHGAAGLEEESKAGGCHAVYTTHKDGLFCPEMFSRLAGHIYFAGLNSAALPLPDAARGKAVPYREEMVKLRQAAREILGSGLVAEDEAEDDDLEIVREGLCFRPVTPWGAPIVSRIRDRDLGAGVVTAPGAGGGGVFVAAGHGPWGIAMSLGTGMVLAEMVQGRELSADVSGLGFDAERMRELCAN